ncbi:FxSxx-COOH system tetratricopeptide repeat protein [Herbidospora yilanensis]|uniref:FxSxx-COOH system tetratricopeptide repeat protein n=1 Tax=Herbidospora yilanensis TaxID=354426 RepID=UPI00078527A5|nr:FxSxx-COOH system tetratricopeptide repeat protein [Herbidospora yilanensis]
MGTESSSLAAHSLGDKQPEIFERVPPRNGSFTGRESLLHQLREGTRSVTAVIPLPQALQGYGGVGKTHLAIEYAHRYRSHYDLVWWIPADQYYLVPSALAALAPHLKLTPASVVGVEEAAESVREALENGAPYNNWLLIFDNAEDARIERFIPRGPGHVIITSRNPNWDDQFRSLQVDVFTRDESIEFLTKRLGARITKDEAFRLADKLGDLPLALEQVGALQRRGTMTVDDYIELLDKQTARLLGAERARDYPLTMTAAWRVSVSLLEERLEIALNLLRCCAFFGPDPIPLDVFRRGNKANAPSLEKLLADPIMFDKSVKELSRYALIRSDPDNRTIQVHRLIQALLRDDLDEARQDRQREEVHRLLAGSAPQLPDDNSKWPDFADLVPHVRPSRLLESREPSVREFALNVVRYLYSSGNYRSALELVTASIDEWGRARENHPDVLRARRHQGNTLRRMGEYAQVYDLDRTTLANVINEFGPEHEETLIARNGLGGSMRARGDFREALELDEESVRQHERLLGDDHVLTLRAKNSLALDFGLNSQYERARRLHTEVYLAQSEAANPASSEIVLLSRNSMARAVRLTSGFEEACDTGEDALAFGVLKLGRDHWATLITAKDLSIAQRRAGALDQAISIARDTHARLARLFGPRHPDTIAAAVNVSNALRVRGDLAEAYELAEEMNRAYPSVFGGDHPFTLACQTNLGILHRLLGDPRKARDVNEAAREGLTARLGPEHHYVLSCMVNLASDLAALGESEQARALGEGTLEHLTERFGRDHFLTLSCAANLVLDRIATEAPDADKLRIEVADLYQERFEQGQPDAVTAASGVRIDCDFDPLPI